MKLQGVKIIDFHSHILPRADHGSDSVEMSLSQLKILDKAGIDIVVATPHFYPETDTVEEFLQRRALAVERLSKVKKSRLKIAVGAEVYCIDDIDKNFELEKLTIKGTNTLLLEMPMGRWSPGLINTVFRISEKFDVVLAHVDRYQTGELDKLLYIDIPVQINARNSSRACNRPRVREWLEDGLIAAIGTDIHKKDAATVRAFKRLQRTLKNDIKEILSRTAELISGAELF